MENPIQHIVTQSESGMRLDKFVSEKEQSLSRSFIQKLILDGQITVNGLKNKPSYNVRAGDVINASIIIPNQDEMPKPEDIYIEIIYEDDEIIVVNKPAGMVVHPAPGNITGTLVNALISHIPSISQEKYDDESDIDDLESADAGLINQQRPGIVHRIDKGTSGLLVIAKTVNAYYSLASQAKEHSMKRKYIAIICGIPKQDKGTIIAPIGRSGRDRKKMAVTPVNSKIAITHFAILEKYKKFSLVEARLETGRTHQIRVHFAYIGHPIVGDLDYGGQNRALKMGANDSIMKLIKDFTHQALHAQTLGFIHPKTNKYIEFSSEIPKDMQILIDNLRIER